jgi:hypothetical protein
MFIIASSSFSLLCLFPFKMDKFEFKFPTLSLFLSFTLLPLFEIMKRGNPKIFRLIKRKGSNYYYY